MESESEIQRSKREEEKNPKRKRIFTGLKANISEMFTLFNVNGNEIKRMNLIINRIASNNTRDMFFIHHAIIHIHSKSTVYMRLIPIEAFD